MTTNQLLTLDGTLAELLDERLVKGVQLEVGEDRCQPLPPKPELPIAEHVRRHRWTDHVVGLLQPLPQRPFESHPCPLEGHDSSEVGGRKLLNPKPLTLMLEPSTERELKWLENRRVLEQRPHRPVKLTPGEILECLGKRD